MDTYLNCTWVSLPEITLPCNQVIISCLNKRASTGVYAASQHERAFPFVVYLCVIYFAKKSCAYR